MVWRKAQTHMAYYKKTMQGDGSFASFTGVAPAKREKRTLRENFIKQVEKTARPFNSASLAFFYTLGFEMMQKNRPLASFPF